MRRVILILAKAPQPGSVKTRLCPPATPETAARIAAAALLDTLDAAAAVPEAHVAVALSGDLDRAERAGALRTALGGCTVFGQRGSGLGARIAAAHADAGAEHPGLPVLQIGMDTPQVTAELLAAGSEPLLAAEADAVLGPATDGGWWALGLRDPGHAAVLGDVPTSRPDTGSLTEKALRSSGLALEALPELSDVDTGEDALRVADAAPRGRFAAAVEALR